MTEYTNGGRSRAYEALRESEELHRATLSNISDAVFLTDDSGAFTFICSNVDVIFGYIPDEVQAMGVISRLLGDNLFDAAELATAGEIRNLERQIITKSGDQRTVLIHLKAVSIKGGTVLYTCRDITDRKKAEEELRTARLDLAHASRLALLGELMASITHEISQPLTSILSNAGAGLRLLADNPGKNELSPLLEILTDIRDQSRVAADVIERIRTLVSKRPLEVRLLNVSQIVSDMLRLVESDARRRGITVGSELASQLPKVYADPVGLQQVVLNLIMNAMDEMDYQEAGERKLIVRASPAQQSVEVAIIDTGRGIPKDRLSKVFDAFFTTKDEGIGLGLAIARSIIETHGGKIWVESDSGRGATFRFSLPAATD